MIPPKLLLDGETVYILDTATKVQSGVILTPPTTLSKHYTIKLDKGTTINAKVKDVYTEHNVPATGIPSDLLGFLTPKWMKQGVKVTCFTNNEMTREYLNLDKDYFWEFVTRGHDGTNIVNQTPLPDLNYS